TATVCFPKGLSHPTLERSATMAEDTMTRLEGLRKGAAPAGAGGLGGAGRGGREAVGGGGGGAPVGGAREGGGARRKAQSRGARGRPWDRGLGTLERAIPKPRSGSSVPGWLAPRRRAEQALVAVITEAYGHGVSTRKVEALVQSLGIMGVSKSEVSRRC